MSQDQQQAQERDDGDLQMQDEAAHQQWLVDAEAQAEYKLWLTMLDDQRIAPQPMQPAVTKLNAYERGFHYDVNTRGF